MGIEADRKINFSLKLWKILTQICHHNAEEINIHVNTRRESFCEYNVIKTKVIEM